MYSSTTFSEKTLRVDSFRSHRLESARAGIFGIWQHDYDQFPDIALRLWLHRPARARLSDDAQSLTHGWRIGGGTGQTDLSVMETAPESDISEVVIVAQSYTEDSDTSVAEVTLRDKPTCN